MPPATPQESLRRSIGSTSVTPSARSNFPLNAQWYGVAADGETADDDAIEKAIAVGQENGAKVLFPEGRIRLTRHFPVRSTDEPVVALEDYNGIVIEGMGEKTVFWMDRPGGTASDVFQLNGVKNITFRNFSVEAAIPTVVDPTGNGSNAFSITGGFSNVEISGVYIKDMPYYDDGASLDGGSGISVQIGDAGATTALDQKDLRLFNNVISGALPKVGSYGFGSYGISISCAGTRQLTNPVQGLIVTGNLVKNVFRGFVFEVSGTGGGTTPAIPKMNGLIANNTAIDCQQGFIALGCTGLMVAPNTVRSSFGSGNPGFTSFDATKYGLVIASCYRCTFDLTIYEANCNYFASISAASEGFANSPSTNVFLNVNCQGASDGYGVNTGALSIGSWAQTCIIHCVAQGAALGDVHPLLYQGVLQNVITTPASSSIPKLNGAVADAGINVLQNPDFTTDTIWTKTGPEWTIAGGKAVAAATLINSSLFQNVNLIAGRAYEAVVVVDTFGASTAGIFIFEENGGDTQLNSTMIGATGTFRRVFIPLLSASYRVGIFTAAGYTATHESFTFGEVAVRAIGTVHAKSIVADSQGTYANNAAAVAAGLRSGQFYQVTATDPRQVAQVI